MNRNSQPNVWCRITTSVALLAIVSLGPVSKASATLLLSDNFNTPDTTFNVSPSQNNLGNNLATRQAGTLAPLLLAPTFTGATGAGVGAIHNDALLIQTTGGTYGRVSYNHNFTDAGITAGGRMVISLDLNMYVDTHSTVADRSFDIAIGQPAGTVGTAGFADSSTSFGVLWDNAGNVLASQGASQSSVLTTFSPTGYEILQVSLVLHTVSFAAGAPASVDLYINGALMNLGSWGSFTWVGNNADYITFSEATVPAMSFDNLEFSTIPEPGVCSLLVLGGALVVRLRRQAARRG